ncbi:MAG TPA: 6,7-dimethyl-8-ribityllumazine synthase [Terriglobales bacterium]|jgi:6,7-dimethyl-8-ribityllumazine synthase
MIKWVSFGIQARTEEDAKRLAALLEALGFGKGEVEQYPHLWLQSFTPSVSVLEITHRKEPSVLPDLELMISDPDSALEIVKRMNLEVSESRSGPDAKHTIGSFVVRLPGGTEVRVTGVRVSPKVEQVEAGLEGNLDARGKKFAVVVSRFNSFITERLLSGAIEGLRRCGGAKDIDIVRVPGAFEIPSASRTLAETGKYDAIICLGCLLRGDTAHYDVIVNECTRGIGQSAQDTGVPHAFGVLTCDTLEQAIDRAGLKMGNKGFEASLAAVEMVNLKKAVVGRSSLVVGKNRKSKTRSGSKLKRKR